jgi:hypothetical protein
MKYMQKYTDIEHVLSTFDNDKEEMQQLPQLNQSP